MNSPRWIALSLVAFACGGWPPPVPETDGGSDGGRSSDAGNTDAGVDTGLPDSGMPDAGSMESDAGIVAFNGTYLAENFGSCTRMMGFTGYAPNDGTKHPLFIYSVGTLDNFGYAATFPYNPSQPNGVMLSILQEAARKGFVAVSVEYDNFFLVDCGGLRAKTRCIYDPSEAGGAVRARSSRSTRRTGTAACARHGASEPPATQ